MNEVNMLKILVS